MSADLRRGEEEVVLLVRWGSSGGVESETERAGLPRDIVLMFAMVWACTFGLDFRSMSSDWSLFVPILSRWRIEKPIIRRVCLRWPLDCARWSIKIFEASTDCGFEPLEWWLWWFHGNRHFADLVAAISFRIGEITIYRSSVEVLLRWRLLMKGGLCLCAIDFSWSIILEWSRHGINFSLKSLEYAFRCYPFETSLSRHHLLVLYQTAHALDHHLTRLFIIAM